MDRKYSLLEKIESYFNMLNHILIGSVAIYTSWECYHRRIFPEYTLHVWLSIFGYQILMAEAILTLYSSNTWSIFHSPKTKRMVHWVLQVIGSACAIAGTSILFPSRERHYYTIHGITGLISLIILLFGLINGISALWAQEVYKIFKIKPVISKFFHNFIGIASFVIGMVSLYYGYKYKYFWESDEQDMTYWLMGIVVFNTIASLFGALRALYSQTKTIAQPWISKI